MHTTIRIKLLPTLEQSAALTTTCETVNTAANLVSQVAREREIYNKYDLQKVAYGQAKDITKSSQPAVRVIGKVVDAYKTHRANIKNGNRGKKGSARRVKAEARVIEFRPNSAQPYDDRILSWDYHNQSVRIWVIDRGDGKPGRITLKYTGSEQDLQLLTSRQGESDLLCSRGKWFLAASIPHPDIVPGQTEGMIGVDLGIARVATLATNQGEDVSFIHGRSIEARKNHDRHLREELQKKGSKSAKRKLKKRSGRQSRWMKDTNHCISKQIVSQAKRTGKGIALEDLKGIRDRVRHRSPNQRSTMASWSYRQLADFIVYKATLTGVPVIFVDPAYTSQQCSACGYTAKKNRTTQARLVCRHCGVTINADTNAAINIARRGQLLRAAVNQPNAA